MGHVDIPRKYTALTVMESSYKISLAYRRLLCSLLIMEGRQEREIFSRKYHEDADQLASVIIDTDISALEKVSVVTLFRKRGICGFFMKVPTLSCENIFLPFDR
jgi:hypothetical protein